MPIAFPAPSLNTATDLLHLAWCSTPRSVALDHQTLSGARWLALAGIMQASTVTTLDLWAQAVDQGWDLREGGPWVVHMDRGDLVRPLAERFGIDWAQEIEHPRTDLRGYEMPLSGLGQALAHHVRHNQPTRGTLEEMRAPSVVRAWLDLGLDPTRRVPTALPIYAGMETPIKTLVRLPIPWLGVALTAGAWALADELLHDPRVCADTLGLSQALYAWTVSVWRHQNDDGRTGLQPCEDLSWAQRLMALGAQAHPFAWARDEVESEPLYFHKETPSTHTWAQSVPHHAWLTDEEKAGLEQRCAQAPWWSSAQWALRNAAVGVLPNKAVWWSALSHDTALWSGMGLDEHGRTPLMIALAKGESSIRLGAKPHRTSTEAWQGESIVQTLLACRPQRTQAEVLGLLYTGVVAKLWEPYSLLHASPAHLPQEGLFTDDEVGRLIQTLTQALFPVAQVSHHSDQQLSRWWEEQAPGFVRWLAPHQHDMWHTWVQSMQACLNDGRFPRPVLPQGVTFVGSHEFSVWVEQRHLWATTATDEAVRRCSEGLLSTPGIELPASVRRPRL